MIVKKLSKYLLFVGAFAVSFLGISITSQEEMIAGEAVTVHSLSITEASACGGEGLPNWAFTCNDFGRCAIREAGTPENPCAPQ